MREEGDTGQNDFVGGQRTLDVVFVCTGNQLRSPVAAAALLSTSPQASLRVRSFGTAAVDAERIAPWAHEAAAAAGIDLSSHRQTPLARANLAAADLVVGFERLHLARAVQDAGALRARAFTLAEIVARLEEARRLPAWTSSLSAEERIALAHSLRLEQPALALEIQDPASVKRRKAARLAREVARLSRTLGVRLFR